MITGVDRRKHNHNPTDFSSPMPSRRRRATSTRKPTNWNRKCQRCGVDPWPNWLMCPRCRQLLLLFHEGGYEPTLKGSWNSSDRLSQMMVTY